MRTKKNAAYYFLLLIISYFIYRFQIEKSFNLLTIYILAVSFSFFSFLFKIDSRKTLPVLFVCSLFAMYGFNFVEGKFLIQWQTIFSLLFAIGIMLYALLRNYSLIYKKLVVLLLALPLAAIYLFEGEGLADYKYIPFVIGSFFMFRSISFLHEIKFMKKEVPLLDKLNYFLLTPNFSMPLFPIVDYKSFISSYEGVSSKTLQRALLFICRGLFQLIIYRFIYHHIVIPFDEIKTALQLFVFIIANFMIVLRVVGAYHIAIGMVILCGYNIPDIFNNFFFSTGFSDLWRRINLYWLNFILKVFYYPLYFKIKKIGIYKALFLSTFFCFIITWFLHSYQWFWLKGFFPIEIKDAIFWLGFGLLVSVNTLLQQRKLDQTIERKTPKLSFIKKAISGLGILLVMSILWSIWTSNSMENWWTMILNIQKTDFYQVKIILQLALGYLIVASCYHYLQEQRKTSLEIFSRNSNTILTGFFILLFIFLQVLNVVVWRPDKMYYRDILNNLTNEKLNKADLLMVDNGYYSNLISTNQYCSQVWVNDFDVEKSWTKYISTQTTTPSFDLFIKKGIPFASVKFKDTKYSLNSIGLRDKEYPKLKPDSCYRIVILGGSYEIGNGINDGEDFISRVEDELNTNYNPVINEKHVHIEIINFSTNGYHLIQRLYQYKLNVRKWNPDAILLFIHTGYRTRISNYVNSLVYAGYPIRDAYLKHIIDSAHITKYDSRPLVRERLGSYADSINYYGVREIAKIAREDKANLICVYLPTTKQKGSKEDLTFMKNICSENNLKSMYLTNVFSDHDLSELHISDMDEHPSKEANDLIADKFLENILSHQDYFNIKFTKKIK